MNEKRDPKKRGRKPKGGKIITQINNLNNNENQFPNIIVHLKCCLNDLLNCKNSIDSFHFTKDLNYEEFIEPIEVECNETEEEITNKIIWKKIKQLKHSMHNNDIYDKQSACFWCTCSFITPVIYIPKFFYKNAYESYGCFCSPECGVAYLMNEKLDTSTLFERYYLMNNIYGKIYNYTKNIKPAPSPYYLLDKFLGNLTVEEYRRLYRSDKLIIVANKPLSRSLPELHEDNDEFILNTKIIPSNIKQRYGTILGKAK
jgi:hypothetical protein